MPDSNKKSWTLPLTGRKVRTQSQRRYIVWSDSPERDRSVIVKRTDNEETAIKATVNLFYPVITDRGYFRGPRYWVRGDYWVTIGSDEDFAIQERPKVNHNYDGASDV